MMIDLADILRVLVAVAISIAIVIAVGLGYSHHEKGNRKEQVDNRFSIGFDQTTDSRTALNPRQMVMQSYGQVRSILVLEASLGDRKDLTEREIVDVAKAVPHIRTVSEKLERTYKTYERVRFGSHPITAEEFGSFQRELREVSARIQ
jgi:hypothetical protein